MTLIEVQGYSFWYPNNDKPTLENVSLSIQAGELVLLTGQSASGKSTLAQALAGFLFQKQDHNWSGRILFDQENIAKWPLYQICSRVAYVQQNPEDQFCTLTVLDELAFGLENENLGVSEINKRINQSLEIVQASHLKNRNLETLSGGEKQKIAIASMISLHPDVLILDEPTSNLDPEAANQVFQTLYQMRQTEGLTIIIIEHNLAQLKPFKPRVFAMENGLCKSYNDIASYEDYLFNIKIKLPKLTFNTPKITEPIVQCENLSVKYGEYNAIQNIKLKINQGDFIALCGSNGSGKTTLLNTMMGFLKPSTGWCQVFNMDITKTPTSKLVENIGMVFQNPDHQLFCPTIWDETILAAENLDKLDKATYSRASAWLSALGLDNRKDDHPNKLSYGEKRRLNVLSITLHRPVLLLLDEFLIGQDMSNAHAWMDFFNNLCQQGNAVLFVTHHLSIAEQYCNRLIELSGGRLVSDSTLTYSMSKSSENKNSQRTSSHKLVLFNA